MPEFITYINIPVVIAVYVIMEVLKLHVLNTDKKKTMIPAISALSGAAISILLVILSSKVEIDPNSILNAFASGAVSGLAATGSNQAYRQYKKFITSEK